MKFSDGFYITLLLLISLTLHVVGIWHPQEAVFDEVHFGKFVSGYLTGEYFFDIHPPLGKLMIAGMGKLAGFKPGFDFLNIGEQYPNYQYIWLRMLPALFGSLLAPLVYLLARHLSHSRRAALLAGMFVAFENALLVQSKFILIDSFLLFFGFAALYLFLESRMFFKEGKWGLWSSLLASVCAGLALSVKWTAASFLGLILLFGFFILIKKIYVTRRLLRRNKEVRMAILSFGCFLVIPIIIYTALFAIHFKLLQKPGPGNAFMSARFHQSQQQKFPAGDFAANFYELNLEMFRANQRIPATHSYSSQWYTWPFMLRPVYYWNKDITAGGESLYERIYLIGNPFVWWFSTVAVVFFFVYTLIKESIVLAVRAVRKRFRKKQDIYREERNTFALFFLAMAYIVNFLPFIVIGRVMFLYHYLTALVIAIMITAISFGATRRTILYVLFIGGALAGFAVIFPITYGTLLHGAWPRSIFWLKTWI